MVMVYTDASVSKGDAMVACFIISSDSFIGFNTFEHTDVTSSLNGELIGIRDGLDYAIKCGVSADEEIVVYTDSKAAIQSVQSENLSCVPRQFKQLVSEIHQLCEGFSVDFVRVKGHSKEHNPNKVVDVMCNTLLNYKLKKNGR